MIQRLTPRVGRLCLSALLCLVLLHTGCATVTRGTKEVLVIETDPPGAMVQLSNGMTGTTPTSFRIPRKGDLTVQIIKDGYEPVVINVSTQVAGAGAAGMAGNVLLGGLIGAGIDAYSGGTLEHKPNPVRVNLTRVVPSEPKPVSLPVAARPTGEVPVPGPIANDPAAPDAAAPAAVTTVTNPSVSS